MIVIIKGKDRNRLIIKALSMLSLLGMFYLYYGHMSSKFQEQNEQLVTKLNIKTENKKQDLSKNIEKLIYKEAVVVVDLLNQKHIESISVVEDKLLIVCDYNTNIEPVLIRYGINALVKSTSKNIKIALDINTIVGNKYES
ncbi:MAG: hypothetical protein U9R39_01760 [Campylobacterota bacterium]|nr:hypothetical protein [Campylobacterota bacterium]